MSPTREKLVEVATDAAEHIERLEKALTSSEQREADWRREAKAYQSALLKWEPNECKAFGCTCLVPTAAQVAQLRALGGIEWDSVREFAWQQGLCSVECSERDNVLPFVRQEDAR